MFYLDVNVPSFEQTEALRNGEMRAQKPLLVL
jgi:hypothetical protein